MEKGLARQAAYEIVQRTAMRAWSDQRSFHDLLAAEPDVAARLSPEELKACFDPAWYLRNVDAIYRRCGFSDCARASS
jgi:adenylosuccinate lyase